MKTSSDVVKENQKGSIKSYNLRRTLVLVLVTLPLIILLLLFTNDRKGSRLRSLFAHELSTSSRTYERIAEHPSQSINFFHQKVGLEKVLGVEDLVTEYEVSRDGNIGLVADSPIRKIEYGDILDRTGERTPVVMIRTSLDDSLLQRFLQEHLYSCKETDLNNVKELDNRVKVPIYVYEGYYHSLPTSEKFYSKNPNPLIGRDFMKPAADAFTRAFFDTFRRINSNIFNRLKQELMNSAIERHPHLSDGGGEDIDVCYMLAKWIDRGYHFGDLSIQIHYGKGNDATFHSAWHTDAENSLLHLAVTLRGFRVLHSNRRSSSRGIVEEILEQQHAGDVYLSSSALMRHAPNFFDTDYDTRVIAIHARILYTSKELKRFRSIRTEEAWKSLTNILANNLARADLKVPSVAQVEKRLHQFLI